MKDYNSVNSEGLTTKKLGPENVLQLYKREGQKKIVWWEYVEMKLIRESFFKISCASEENDCIEQKFPLLLFLP